MSFTEDFLDETVAIVQALDATASRRVADGLAAVRERGGRLFILGVGGSAGSRQPRRQRLPQDLRLRGLRADRQRLRADRPHQRRGLGHHVLGVARGLAARPTDARAGVLRGRRRRRAQRLAQHRARRSSWPRSVGAAIFGIVGRDGGYTAQLADACVDRSRRCSPTASRRTPRACARWSGTCWSATRRCSATPPSGSRVA